MLATPSDCVQAPQTLSLIHIWFAVPGVEAADPFAGQYYFYQYDVRGSVTDILDKNAGLVKGYDYDEFGNTDVYKRQIYDRADSTKPNMGLTTWKNAPSGRIRKSDVSIAKNYLDETEMGSLNEIVTMYLDYAERQARRGNIMYMRDWVARLDAFLQFNEGLHTNHKQK